MTTKDSGDSKTYGPTPGRFSPKSTYAKKAAIGNSMDSFCEQLQMYIFLLDVAISTCELAAGVGKVFSDDIGSDLQKKCAHLIGEYNSSVDLFNRTCVL
jgi:hypothetical protein